MLDSLSPVMLPNPSRTSTDHCSDARMQLERYFAISDEVNCDALSRHCDSDPHDDVNPNDDSSDQLRAKSEANLERAIHALRVDLKIDRLRKDLNEFLGTD